MTPANPPSAPASSAAGVDCSGPASGSADRARRARPGDYTTSASRRRRRRWCARQPPARLATPTLFCSPCAIVWRPGRLRASLYLLAPFLLSRCRAEDRVRRPPTCCSWRSTTSRAGKYLEQPRRLTKENGVPNRAIHRDAVGGSTERNERRRESEEHDSKRQHALRRRKEI